MNLRMRSAKPHATPNVGPEACVAATPRRHKAHGGQRWHRNSRTSSSAAGLIANLGSPRRCNTAQIRVCRALGWRTVRSIPSRRRATLRPPAIHRPSGEWPSRFQLPAPFAGDDALFAQYGTPVDLVAADLSVRFQPSRNRDASPRIGLTPPSRTPPLVVAPGSASSQQGGRPAPPPPQRWLHRGRGRRRDASRRPAAARTSP